MTSFSEQTLLEHFTQWLELERVNLLTRAEQAGVPPVVLGNRIGVAAQASGHAVFQEQRVMNPLRDTRSRTLLTLHATGDPAQAAVDIGQSLQQLYGNGTRAWARTVDCPPNELPGQIARAFVLPARDEYLYRLARLDQPQLTLADEIARSAITVVKSDLTTVVNFVPVGGLQIADPLQAGNVTFLPLNAQHLGVLHGPLEWRDDRPVDPDIPFVPPFPVPLDLLERVGIFIRQRHPKDQPPPADYPLQRLVLALQLNGFDPCGVGSATRWTEPSPSLLKDGAGVQIQKRAQARPITLAAVKEAIELSDKIPPTAFEGTGRSSGALALGRFRSAVTDSEATDAILDYAIALEAVLLPQISNEVSFRFSLHGALFLETTPAARKDTQKRFKDLYGMRSKLAHGEPAGSPAAITASAAEARDLCSRVLIKALREGWPNRTAFDNLVLGA